MEDHAADDWRYACMSRPWTRAPRDAGRTRNLTGFRRIAPRRPSSLKVL
jgi:hypothetical protein